MFKGDFFLTAEYPATLSSLLIRAGHAVHGENKLKMGGFKQLATR